MSLSFSPVIYVAPLPCGVKFLYSWWVIFHGLSSMLRTCLGHIQDMRPFCLITQFYSNPSIDTFNFGNDCKNTSTQCTSFRTTITRHLWTKMPSLKYGKSVGNIEMLLKLCGIEQISLLSCIYPHNSRYSYFHPNIYWTAGVEGLVDMCR